MTTQSFRKAMKNLIRFGGLELKLTPWIRTQADTNAKIRSKLNECTVDGKIGVTLSGMDCDCSQYYTEYVCDSWTSVAAFKKYWDEHCDALEGNESQTFCRPELIEPQYRSRDLALMAFEDGHPNVIRPVGFDELVIGGEY